MIFVGANGGGKTRLAVEIEKKLGEEAHRISAHRALTLNPAVPKISERQALSGLRVGHSAENASVHHRQGHRWHGQEAVVLLNDFDFLIQSLFADQANKSLDTHKRNRAGDHTRASPTNFERLIEIWNRLLPHRNLKITGDDILVTINNSAAEYKASDMSDGERAIFYMIGQALTAAPNSVLIIDEPELHVHRSIMSKLWDELEAARPDCGFIFITHDLEFAAARVAQKFVIRDYTPAPSWLIEPVSENNGFDEATITLILGSRRPVLFVEGKPDGLDAAIYRCCYPEWTVIPRESCESVIHSVITLRRNAELTRVTCAGIVDADAYTQDEIEFLNRHRIAVLPVSEIENLILLPSVSRAIGEHEGYRGIALDRRLDKLRDEIFQAATQPGAIDAVVARHCRRRVDRMLKKMDFSNYDTVEEIASEFKERASQVDILAIGKAVREKIDQAIARNDLVSFLASYDQKAFMAFAARRLKGQKLADFESWLTRVLLNKGSPALAAAVQAALPTLLARQDSRRPVNV